MNRPKSRPDLPSESGDRVSPFQAINPQTGRQSIQSTPLDLVLVTMFRLYYIYILLCLLSVEQVYTLDVNWIPNDSDENGVSNIPLSSKYRDSLRKLCNILATSSRIPPELEMKKKNLKKMCKRLAADDSNSNVPSIENIFHKIYENRRNILIGFGLFGGVYYVWKNKSINLFKPQQIHIVDPENIRELRMKRYN